MGNIAKQELNNIGNMIPVARVDRIFNIIYANAAFTVLWKKRIFIQYTVFWMKRVRST